MGLFLDWEGCAGFTEFRSAGKEAGDLVVAGGCPALVFAADAISAIVSGVSGLCVPWLRRAFGLCCDTEGFEVCSQRGDRQERVCRGSFHTVLDDGAPY
jgi:hypothetical protein